MVLITEDLLDVGVNFFFISIVRLLVAGVYRKSVAEKLPDPLFKRVVPSGSLKGERLRKLHENLYYAVWHTSSFVFVLSTLWKEGWFHSFLSTWDAGYTCYDFPHFVSSETRSVYLFELGFWISCLLFLTVETVRKDTAEMTLHHLATISLIAISHMYGYNRVGLVVMLIHDVGDIFLYSAKFCNYLNLNAITNVLFGMFVIVFFVSRLVVFPAVIRVAWGPVTGYIEQFNWRDHSGSILLPSLLLVLQILHIMWFVLIIRMVIRLAKNEKRQVDGDIRSDDEVTSAECVAVAGNSKKAQ